MGKTHYLGPEESGFANMVFGKNPNKEMIVFDVGTNRGLYIDLVKDRPNTKVYGFEPIEHLFNDLTKKYSEYNNVFLNMKALSDSVKKTFFCEILDDIMDGCSSLIERPTFSHRRLDYNKYEIETTSIDIYCQEKNIEFIDLIKIDVEGAELQVMKGAEKMFSENRIGYIQFECGDTTIEAGDSVAEISDFISQFGYYIFQPDVDKLVKLTDFQIESLSNLNNSINLFIKKDD